MKTLMVQVRDEEAAIVYILAKAKAVSASTFVRQLILIDLAQRRLIPECDLEDLGIDARAL